MMMIENIGTYAGYLASVFIVAGFVFKDVFKIRLLNLIGCICFVFYGYFSEEEKTLYPVIIPNVILALVQCYFLLKMKE